MMGDQHRVEENVESPTDLNEDKRSVGDFQ